MTQASNPSRRRSVPIILLLFVLLGGVRWFTNSRNHPAPPPAPGAPVATYTLRGRIEQLPDPAVKGSTLQIHHESIPTFTSRDGTVIGMNEMIMPFPPAPGLSLDGLAIGDNVEFTFEVRWDQIPPQHATRIMKLPSDQKPSILGGK